MDKSSLIRLWTARRQIRSLYRKEQKSPVSTTFQQKLQFWKHGFLSESAAIYDRPANELDEYLSDFARYTRTPFINGRYSEFLNNKILFEQFFGALIEVPKNFGMVHQGKFLPFKNGTGFQTTEDLVDYVKTSGGIVFKPFDGGAGSEVFIMKSHDQKTVVVNSEPLSMEEISSLFAKFSCMMACEFVKQAGYARSIYPHTTNTIRILTIVDPVTQLPCIARAVHRLGNDGSGAVDNWSQGALSAKVNIETGELGPGVGFPRNGKLVFHEKHPNTGADICGVHIPNWQQVRDSLLRAAGYYAFIPYIGWDVVITDDGYKVLEGNNFSDVNLLQVHGPLLSDPVVRRFYEYHEVIPVRRKGNI